MKEQVERRRFSVGKLEVVAKQDFSRPKPKALWQTMCQRNEVFCVFASYDPRHMACLWLMAEKTMEVTGKYSGTVQKYVFR